MLFGFVVIAVVIGTLMPLQAVLNAELARQLRSPYLAALISLSTGALVVGLLAAASAAGELRRLPQVPPQYFLGGLLGAIFVGSSLFLVPKLGATAMVGAFITGQLVGSVLIDHYGLLGLPAQPVSGARLLGVILLFTGLLMVVRKGA
jgi:transporter family-2 protein